MQEEGGRARNNDRRILAATDGDDDLQLVGIRQLDRRMLAARHNLAIVLDRHPFAGKIQFEEEGRNAQRLGKLALLAIDAEGDHFVEPGKSSRMLGREFTTRV
jgi:hypothetical protein